MSEQLPDFIAKKFTHEYKQSSQSTCDKESVRTNILLEQTKAFFLH